jgi:hypothetical protein
VLLVEGHRTEVDDLYRSLLLEAGFDQLALVSANDALADGLLDLPETRLDLTLIRGGAELPQEVLEHVDGDVEADIELLDQVLADHAACEGVEKPPVEVVDRNLVDSR